MLLWGTFTSWIPSGIFVDRWRSQSQGGAPTLPLPCEVCILKIHFTYKGPDNAYTGVMKYVKNFRVGMKIMLGKSINTLFANKFIGTGSVIIMALYLDILNDKIHGLGMYALENGLKNEGVWYDGQKYGNSAITGISGDTYTRA